jgi:ribonuclease P protein component
VASKAAIPLATGRNQFKRTIFQYFHEQIASLEGRDIVVIAANAKGLSRVKDAIIKELQKFSDTYL